ncbi:hypothetical protein A0H81_06899 [Grifola frondosa]|uniref:Uncharacterized protein n=1 Tax=Grifola frondosa TaxID=5627 RepID=A0A1C7M9B8_GRIFR|nr:hypothetical protein A0H81_06899 [Grifola frondosa]
MIPAGHVRFKNDKLHGMSPKKSHEVLYITEYTSRLLSASPQLKSLRHVVDSAWAKFIPMVALTKNCKSIKVVRDLLSVAAGCGATVLTSTIVMHILVRGQVDLDAEIVKCGKKLAITRMNLEKIRKTETLPDYAATIPENVRLDNEEKLYNSDPFALRRQRKPYEEDVKTLEYSIDVFTRLI